MSCLPPCAAASKSPYQPPDMKDEPEATTPTQYSFNNFKRIVIRHHTL